MVKPYIVFNGNCKAALEFYRAAFDSDSPITLPYGDYVPEGFDEVPEGLRDWILHAEMDICGGSFWFADEVDKQQAGSMVRLSVSVPAKVQAREIFDRLCDGGKVTLPPTETFYSAFHAAVTDRFGVNWNVVAEEASAKGNTR